MRKNHTAVQFSKKQRKLSKSNATQKNKKNDLKTITKDVFLSQKVKQETQNKETCNHKTLKQEAQKHDCRKHQKKNKKQKKKVNKETCNNKK